MISTGNDIISLNAINTERTKQPGFYSKILSISEQALYNVTELSTIPFENFVWLLWSIKESAFKYLQRSNPDLIFSPTKFIVQQLHVPLGYSITRFDEAKTEGSGFNDISTINSTINVGSQTLYSRSITYKELIVSVVNGNENFENACWGIKTINNQDPIYQSKAVRDLLADRLNRVFDTDNLLIGKSLHGFPVVMEGSNELAIPVSLAHHDNFIAYSMQYTTL